MIESVALTSLEVRENRFADAVRKLDSGAHVGWREGNGVKDPFELILIPRLVALSSEYDSVISKFMSHSLQFPVLAILLLVQYHRSNHPVLV